MLPVEHALPLACAASGLAWSLAAAARADRGTADLAVRALLGGLAAYFLASASYDVAGGAGLPVTWERLVPGDRAALAFGAAIGFIEESAKLLGLLLVVERGWGRRDVAAAAVGVAAGFAALEAAVALHGSGWSSVIGARVALAPIAHAILFIPVAVAVSRAVRRGGRAWCWLAPALALSATFHAAGNLSLTLTRFGRLGYAAALLAPVLLAFVALRGTRARATPRLAAPR